MKDEGSFAAVYYQKAENSKTGLGIFDLSSGKLLQSYELSFDNANVMIQDSGKDFDYFALIHFKKLFVVDKYSNQYYR